MHQSEWPKVRSGAGHRLRGEGLGGALSASIFHSDSQHCPSWSPVHPLPLPSTHLHTELALRRLLSRFPPPAYNPPLPLDPQTTHVLQKPLLEPQVPPPPSPPSFCYTVSVTSAGKCPLSPLPGTILLLFIATLTRPFLFLQQTLTCL